MISDVKTRPVPYDLQSDEPSKDWRGYPVHPNWKYVLLDHGHETYMLTRYGIFTTRQEPR